MMMKASDVHTLRTQRIDALQRMYADARAYTEPKSALHVVEFARRVEQDLDMISLARQRSTEEQEMLELEYEIFSASLSDPDGVKRGEALVNAALLGQRMPVGLSQGLPFAPTSAPASKKVSDSTLRQQWASVSVDGSLSVCTHESIEYAQEYIVFGYWYGTKVRTITTFTDGSTHEGQWLNA